MGRMTHLDSGQYVHIIGTNTYGVIGRITTAKKITRFQVVDPYAHKSLGMYTADKLEPATRNHDELPPTPKDTLLAMIAPRLHAQLIEKWERE
jgi:spore cortex formation protein SpoVR/YcgB (stage V sporulation)